MGFLNHLSENLFNEFPHICTKNKKHCVDFYMEKPNWVDIFIDNIKQAGDDIDEVLSIFYNMRYDLLLKKRFDKLSIDDKQRLLDILPDEFKKDMGLVAESFEESFDEALVAKKDWRLKYVWHRTPTGRRSRAMVMSLPPEEQEKYKPFDLKSKEDDGVKRTKKSSPKVYSMDFYIGLKNGVEDLEEGKYVEGTDDSGKALEFEDKGLEILRVYNLPITSVKKYKNDKGKWTDFDPDMSDKEKLEFVKFQEIDHYILDVFPYKDQIERIEQ